MYLGQVFDLINSNDAFPTPINPNLDVTGFFPRIPWQKAPVNSFFSGQNSD